jgi:ABC-type amino acid transport substrate-binding protein
MGASSRAFLVCLAALLSACGAFPRDIDGTLDRLRSAGIVRVGLIAGPETARDRALIGAYLDRVGRATGAAPRIVTGAAEPLLAGLEAGQIDLVVGEIATDSPWITDVAVIEPLAERMLERRRIGLSPIARNGENQWIMLLEREVRDMQAGR